MDVDRVIGRPRFRREAERLLELVGSQDGPIPPDPELAGSPEPVRVRADLLLPLPGRAVRVRLYRDAPATPRPLLLWLHGGGFVGGSPDDAGRYARRLEDAGVAVSYLEYGDTPHAFLNFPGVLSVAWTAMRDVADDLTAFLAR